MVVAVPDNCLRDAEADRFVERTFPFRVRLNLAGGDLPMDANEWCEDQFGPDCLTDVQINGTYYYQTALPYRWTTYSGQFYFGSEIDATAFKIRWG